MKIAIINKSDSTGGAAVASFRLMNALRTIGIDARLIVTEKLTDSPYVICAANPKRAMIPFLAERLKIYLANGRNRSTLFRIDTCSDGLPLHKIPFVKEADVICLNWVNQGMLSITGIEKLLKLGKPIVWTMHDMWCMTGICHHAGYCERYLAPDGECQDCPLMPAGSRLSTKTLHKKLDLYNGVTGNRINFVCVSNWLAQLAKKSTLIKDQSISVIPNAFPIDKDSTMVDFKPRKADRTIIFGAARLDDPVKGFPTLIQATQILHDIYPDHAKHLKLVTFGSIKNPELLKDIAIEHTHLGKISPSQLKTIYVQGDMVVSTSEWETFGYTLIEGQAWGCIPVALDHGGQGDIIDHLETGYLAPYSDDPDENATSIAEGIVWAYQAPESVRTKMHKNVCDRFSEEAVATQYISLFKSLI